MVVIMFEFFALLGGFWFFVFVMAFLVVGIVSAEVGSSVLGTFTFLLGLLGLEFLFGVPVIDTVIDNPATLVVLFIVYAVVGALYTLLWRWPEFLREHNQDIVDGYNHKRRQYPDGEYTYKDYVTSYDYKYSASRHADPIIAWMVTWPFSLVWELARKPVKFVSTQVYNLTKDAFEKIGVSTVKGIIEKK